MLPASLIELAEELTQALRSQGEVITAIESCTGGLVAYAITSVPGSSDVYPGGFITYSDELKHSLVGVAPETLREYGAVSAQTAAAMASGGLERTKADFAIAITGIAGPGGGSTEKPVGTVWICVARQAGLLDCRRFVFDGGREAVRRSAAVSSMHMAIQAVGGIKNTLPGEAERYVA